jgi:TRAP-type C4-dicarboxylate transport system substrate-binding protein
MEALSGGQLVIEQFSSNELVPDDQLMPATRAGTIDVAFYVGAIDPSLTPLAKIETFMPYGVQSQEESMAFWRHSGFWQMVEEGYAEYGVKFLGPAYFDPCLTFVTTKPVRTYEDLDGLKLSSYEAYAIALIRAGTALVNLPPEEYYLAGTTGVVDALGWGCGAYYMYNLLHEAYPYYLNESVGPWACQIIMNQDVYDSMPDNLKAIMKTTAEYCTNRTWAKYYYDEVLARSLFKEVTEFSAEDRAKLVANAMAYWDDTLALESPEMAQAVAMYKDWNRLVERDRWHRTGENYELFADAEPVIPDLAKLYEPWRDDPWE